VDLTGRMLTNSLQDIDQIVIRIDFVQAASDDQASA
jgi:hypothetical protein